MIESRVPVEDAFHSICNHEIQEETYGISCCSDHRAECFLVEVIWSVLEHNNGPMEFKFDDGHLHRGEEAILTCVMDEHAVKVQHDDDQDHHLILNRAPHS